MEQLKEFLDFAVTPYHTVAALKKKLIAAGFEDALDFSKLEQGKQYFAVRGGTSIFAFTLPTKITENTVFHIAASHSDFPGLRLAPNCDKYNVTGHTLHPEIYGSPILSSWFDRDLGIAGCVIDSNLKEHLFCDNSLCKITNLAIHLTHGSTQPATLNKQTELNALCDFEETLEKHLENVVDTSSSATKESDYHSLMPSANATKILSYDARLYDKQPATISSTLISSGRLDNLLSAEASVRAITNCKSSKNINIACVFDHEEIGSKTREGAGGNMLEASISKIWNALGGSQVALYNVLEKSFMLSIDAAHAVHPNHLEVHDSNNMPELGKGTVIKYSALKRYATDIYSEAYFKSIAGDIPLQTFVNRNDNPGGSTVGPTLSSAFGMPTLDVGVPLLSMHSIRETAHVKDFYNLQHCIEALFKV